MNQQRNLNNKALLKSKTYLPLLQQTQLDHSDFVYTGSEDTIGKTQVQKSGGVQNALEIAAVAPVFKFANVVKRADKSGLQSTRQFDLHLIHHSA
mmetsp:Transcript_22747/g.33953  ORF Transcript_22747/g.33953 Transcript_22747/m.33953 type:complete len:95 (-) Transcript_22747:317-601(-)